MKKTILTLFGIAILGMGFSQTVYKDAQDGRLWLKLKDDITLHRTTPLPGQTVNDDLNKYFVELPFMKAIAEQYGVSKISKPFAKFKSPGVSDVYQIEFSDIQKVDDFEKALNNVSTVKYAEKVPLFHKTLTPNDPSYGPGQQWNLFQINSGQAWDVTTGNSNIVVAVVDDAVDITHPDLSPVLWTNSGEIPGNGIDDDNNGYVDDVNGVDVANGTGNPNPIAPFGNFDHGTHVAGIATAASNNGTGIASIGYNVSLMGIRSASNNASLTSTLQGVLYAIDNGANVINMSYGSSFFSQTYQNAINNGVNQGVVMVAAAGNDNVDDIFYPAGYNNVISVAASNGSDAKAGFSNYDDGSGWITLAAPGTSIYSTLPSQGSSNYGTKQGTSMASPLVAGLAGLMLSLNPALLPSDIENCMTTTCDPATGSFSGLMGAGRINALEAMNCVASTLNFPPQAEFTADLTTIAVGGQVNFTDLSIYNPTSWSWTFQGGTPGTSTQQNPQNITYNNPGTYQVSLTVTNANGNDSEIKTGYITVNPSTGCDSVTHTLPNDTIYTRSWANNGGYLGGTNSIGVEAYADFYSASLFPANSYIQSMIVYFTNGVANNPNDLVTMTIWNSVGGNPGAVLHTETVSLQTIEDNQTVPGQPNSFYPTIVYFDQPFQITGDFFIGISVPNPVPGGQEYSIAYTHDFNNDATGRPNYTWLYAGPGNTLNGGTAAPVGWYEFDVSLGGINYAMHMTLRTTQFPVDADIQASSTNVCSGDEVDFQNGNMTNVSQNEWFINGVNNGNTTANNPSFIYNSPGTYAAYLVANNTCGYIAIDSVDITVNASPVISVTPQDELICPGDNVNLTASGANSYTWSPSGSLSAGTGANVTSTPTQTTTYSVVGTSSNGCSSNSEVTVIVEETPVSDISFTPNTGICFNQPIYFDGGLNSEGVTNYQWSFDSGSPASSANSTEFVSFPSAGTYTVTLDGSNNCGDNDVATVNVTILDCDFNSLEENENQGIFGFMNPENEALKINFTNMNSGKYEVNVYSLTGQKVQSKTLNVVDGNGTYTLSTIDMAEGLYITHVTQGDMNYSFKFTK